MSTISVSVKENNQAAVSTALQKHRFQIKDPGSAITHFVGMVLAGIAAVPLMVRSVSAGDTIHVFAQAVFIISMILLYAASTTYHTVDASATVNRVLRKWDHMMIYVLIAGSYTPICLIALHGRTGNILLAVVWGIATLGMIFNACWITCPKWLSSILYITLGWACMLTSRQLLQALPATAFYWLLAGGIIYTVGGVIYALKLPIFNSLHKNFGSHEIFHIFVMAGSACHFVMMYQFLSTMPIH